MGASACHKTSSSPTTQAAPLSSADAHLFERGVDFIAKPEGLEGRWRDDWSTELDQRVRDSDLVALISVRTLRTDTAPDQRVTHRIAAHVDRVISGKGPSDELELATDASAAGFASVDQAIQRLSEHKYVAFVKWAPDEHGEPKAFFHLSPASEEVLTETEGAVTRVRPRSSSGGEPEERVIVHNN
ncbi:MAG: hypothetical protein QM778_08330 [Myxococcales bacterium]